MSPSLDKYLCDKYPKIFADRCKSPQETCMCWGFPSNGWFQLIDSLCSSIQNHVNNPDYKPAKTFKNYIKKPLIWICDKFRWYKIRPSLDYVDVPKTQVIANQVKEKFGGLRFYVSGADDTVDGMILLAETLSYHICENCGVMDETVVCTGRGWIQTLCMKCRKPSEIDIHMEVQRKYCSDKILAIVASKQEKN